MTRLGKRSSELLYSEQSSVVSSLVACSGPALGTDSFRDLYTWPGVTFSDFIKQEGSLTSEVLPKKCLLF
ncbi:hypothetical protein Y1Q_0014781 [Alligator mississippiensis]|uniref:Uncharacterized protein n=1 Tax=Alligator mississippiensis TaxID=8496 RepID=A0A151M1X5_ALLMI|nr:hypothetical protein Y1Q_0014781 [Alligator mississippiensis]